jgi:chromosome segregation ATPase
VITKAKHKRAKAEDQWTPLADKLREAVAELRAARAQHQAALDDAKTLLDSAEQRLSKAMDAAIVLIEDVSETPPGTFPAITG